MCHVGFVTGVSVVDRVGSGNLNIPTGCERGTPNPKKPSLFPLISEKRHHNPIEGFMNICSMEISKERGKE